MDKSFFDRVLEAGIPYNNNCSDLQVKNCKELQEILKDFPDKTGVLAVKYWNRNDKSEWIDFPFAYPLSAIGYF